MIRSILASFAGALMVVAFAGCWLWYADPAHGAECRTGIASYYGTESGSRTATGEHFDGSGMTAAMPSRKHLGERWRVSYAGRSIVVRINDLGPRADLGRAIDLSRAAFKKLAPLERGTIRVCLKRVG